MTIFSTNNHAQTNFMRDLCVIYASLAMGPGLNVELHDARDVVRTILINTNVELHDARDVVSTVLINTNAPRRTGRGEDCTE